MITRLSLLLMATAVAYLSCSKNPSGPKDTFKDPRQYTWSVDTLAYPGSIQTDMTDIWGSSPKDVYVVGHNERGFGKMFHFDGKTWTPINQYHPDERGNASIDLSAIYGFAANDIWTVGERNYDNPSPPPNFLDSSLIIHYDGMTWKEVKIRSRRRFLQSVWGSSPTDIWMGGLNGTLYHYDGTSVISDSVPLNIHQQADPFYNFFSITGKSHEEVYMLLFAPPPGIVLDRFYLFRRQSNSWAIADSMQYSYYSSIWMSPSGVLYATGSAVRRREGNSWHILLEGLSSHKIYGTSDKNLLVVGISGVTDSRGEVYHYNGIDWFQFQNLRLPNVLYSGVWTDGKEVFVVGFTLDFPVVSIVLHGR